MRAKKSQPVYKQFVRAADMEMDDKCYMVLVCSSSAVWLLPDGNVNVQCEFVFGTETTEFIKHNQLRSFRLFRSKHYLPIDTSLEM